MVALLFLISPLVSYLIRDRLYWDVRKYDNFIFKLDHYCYLINKKDDDDFHYKRDKNFIIHITNSWRKWLDSNRPMFIELALEHSAASTGRDFLMGYKINNWGESGLIDFFNVNPELIKHLHPETVRSFSDKVQTFLALKSNVLN